MDKEKIYDVKNVDSGEMISRSTDPFRLFIPAGITWFAGLLFLQEINHIFVWWTLTCGWFPLCYAMKRKDPSAEKKWNIANGFAVAILLVIPFLFSLLYIAVCSCI